MIVFSRYGNPAEGVRQCANEHTIKTTFRWIIGKLGHTIKQVLHSVVSVVDGNQEFQVISGNLDSQASDACGAGVAVMASLVPL
jgi:hypothetical protein